MGIIFRLSFYKPFLSRTLHPHHLSRHKRVYSSASIFCNLAIPLATNKMSEIPKKQTQTAPTPQNTPANNAPISSHAQQPGVGTIKEEEFDRAAAASIFAQNPKGVQKEHSKLEAEFQEEVLELEKKYFAKFTPLYQKREKIVNGDTEPSKDEIEAGEADEEDEDEEDGMEAEKTE